MENPDNLRRKRTQKDYNLGFKLAVVAEVESGSLTYKEAQKKYGIQGRSTVLVWLRKHGSVEWSTASRRARPVSPEKETPAQKIKRLEKELEDERIRNLVMKEMITIVDQEHGTDLRKKYSAEVSARCKNKAK